MRRATLVLLVSLTTCVGSQPSPCTDCSGTCVDLTTDSFNCGACGTKCGTGTRCEMSTCVANSTASCSLDCGARGVCVLADGGSRCQCLGGYSGAQCDACPAGQQDKDDNGTCTPDCSSLTCLNSGTCSDTTGTATCSCDGGFAGSVCAQCAPGYQDNDRDGFCNPSCALAGLTCSNGGHCADSSGSAACVCAAGYTGPSCAACATGYRDEDGDGKCALPCTSAPLTPDAGTARLMVRLENHTTSPLGAGTVAFVPLPQGNPVNAWLLPDAGGVSLLFHELDGGFTPLQRSITPADGGTEGTVVFKLRAALAAGQSTTQYGLYQANSNVLVGNIALIPPAVRVDTGASLVCDVRSNFFFTIQLRQVGPQLYETVVADGTGDGAAMAKIVVTNSADGGVIRDRTYGDGAGSCCTAPTIIAQDRFSITVPTFKVRLESREYSGSHRYFGCEDFGTGNPPTSQLGVNEFNYVVTDAPSVTGAFCGQ
jgi:hypothetical protein